MQSGSRLQVFNLPLTCSCAKLDLEISHQHDGSLHIAPQPPRSVASDCWMCRFVGFAGYSEAEG